MIKIYGCKGSIFFWKVKTTYISFSIQFSCVDIYIKLNVIQYTFVY